MLQNPWSEIWAEYPHHSVPLHLFFHSPLQRCAPVIFSNTASSFRSIKSRFWIVVEQPAQKTSSKGPIWTSHSKFLFFFLCFCFFHEGWSSDFHFLDITCKIFQRLEFPWNWSFRETWISVTPTWNSKSHGKSSFTETPVHGNSSFTETSPTPHIYITWFWRCLISSRWNHYSQMMKIKAFPVRFVSNAQLLLT